MFDKLKEPVFLKEDSSAQTQLNILRNLQEVPTDMTAQLEQDIRNLTAGIDGENSVAFELKNSHLPMFVLHDLYLEYEGLSAQIDYLIITRQCSFIVECKKLYGNIQINERGDFIRWLTYGGKTRSEGIYSPVTQNTRHLELIKQIRGDLRTNFITKAIFEKNFYGNYRSAIVLANTKTVLNAQNAPDSIKEQVIRSDQLVEFIKRANKQSGLDQYGDKAMETTARFFLNQHKEQTIDYVAKYHAKLPEPEPPAPETIVCPRCGAPMIKRTAKKGTHEGKEFYGCSNYPKCRGIVNI